MTQGQECHLYAVSTESTGDLLLAVTCYLVGHLVLLVLKNFLKVHPGPASGLFRQDDLGCHAALTFRLCWPRVYPLFPN